MRNTIVLGAGPCGLAAAMMLARDGHDVTVLERDPSPVPDTPEAAWERWERGGVAQFRQAHFLHARGPRRCSTRSCPTCRARSRRPARCGSTRSRGCRRRSPTARRAPGDERLVTLTARRPTLEQVLGRAADAEPGVEVRRGVAVDRLAARRRRPPHVTGVRDDGGRAAARRPRGRRDGPPLAAAAAARRRRRATDARGGRGQRLHLLHALLPPADGACRSRARRRSRRSARSPSSRCPADAGTWSVTLYIVRGRPAAEAAAPRATAGRRSCAPARCTRTGSTASRSPASLRDGRRRSTATGASSATARPSPPACRRRPTPGRARTRRSGAASRSGSRTRRCCATSCASTSRTPRASRDAWDEATERELTPWYRATVAIDRARLAEIDALRTGAGAARAGRRRRARARGAAGRR